MTIAAFMSDEGMSHINSLTDTQIVRMKIAGRMFVVMSEVGYKDLLEYAGLTERDVPSA